MTMPKIPKKSSGQLRVAQAALGQPFPEPEKAKPFTPEHYDKAKRACAVRRLSALAYGNELTFSFNENDLEMAFGLRERKALVTRLVVDGYLAVCSEHPCAHMATDKAVNELEPRKPDIVGLLKSDLSSRAYEECKPGADIWELEPEEIVYVLGAGDTAHAWGYQFVAWDPWSKGVQPLVNGDFKARKSHNHPIVVSDAAYREKRVALIAEAKHQELFRQNLPWGLSTLDLVAVGDEKLFRTSASREYLSDSAVHFGVVPEKWGEDLAASLERAREAKARAEREIATLTAVQEKILAAHFGCESGDSLGPETVKAAWATFRAKYDEELRAAVKKTA